MTPSAQGTARSIQVRLARHAREIGTDPNLVLARFATERFLYRLACSPHADRFVLKGALLMLVWLGETIRPTRDADLLGFGDLSAEHLAPMFREVCERSVAPDGIVFDAASIRVAQIRPEDAYGGQRVTLVAHLGPARIRVQIDVGIGDAVVPEPEWIDYPALLDLPRPRLRAYRKETAIAEKAQAIVALGLRNSRMRDFFDVRELALRETFEGTTLSSAISATFDRRHTAIPATLPLALSDEFASDAEKSAQWAAYMNLIGRQADRGQFGSVIDDIRQFLFPVFRALSIGEPFQMIWSRSGPWSNPETPR